MKTETQITSPNIIGAGLVCLDIIKDEKSIRYSTGGSCGNVISALSFLGCKASIITNNYNDKAWEIVKANLSQLGIDQFTIANKPSASPRIIERLNNDLKGTYVNHRFLYKCPECSRSLPKYKHFSKNLVLPFKTITSNCNVFYSDRSSPGINYLRSTFKNRGNLTIYEPNSARNLNAFINSSLNSRVVKFSDERISFHVADRLKEKAPNGSTLLIVQTKGKDGLIFSYRKRNQGMSKWIHLDSQPTPALIDTAGAGDWCTAGLIVGLTNKSLENRNWFVKEEIVAALQYGQALSAISCAFIGGQGLIYANDTIEKYNNLFNNVKMKERKVMKTVSILTNRLENLCHTCLQ